MERYKIFNGKKYQWVNSALTLRGAKQLVEKYHKKQWAAKIVPMSIGYAIYGKPYGE